MPGQPFSSAYQIALKSWSLTGSGKIGVKSALINLTLSQKCGAQTDHQRAVWMTHWGGHLPLPLVFCQRKIA